MPGGRPKKKNVGGRPKGSKGNYLIKKYGFNRNIFRQAKKKV